MEHVCLCLCECQWSIKTADLQVAPVENMYPHLLNVSWSKEIKPTVLSQGSMYKLNLWALIPPVPWWQAGLWIWATVWDSAGCHVCLCPGYKLISRPEEPLCEMLHCSGYVQLFLHSIKKNSVQIKGQMSGTTGRLITGYCNQINHI